MIAIMRITMIIKLNESKIMKMSQPSAAKSTLLLCHQVRPALADYAQGALSPRRRARMARHLDGCPTCRAELQAQRTIARELTAVVPFIGSASMRSATRDGRMEEMWRDIAAQLVLVGTSQPPINLLRLASGAVVLTACILVVMMFVPRTTLNGVPTPPTAAETVLNHLGTPVASAFDIRMTIIVPVLISASPTLTPRLQSNYAPVAGATGTP